LHALDHFEYRLGGLRFLDGNGAFGADLLDRFRHHLADDCVVVRRNGGHLRLFTLIGHRAGQRPEGVHSRSESARETALQIDGAGSGSNVPNSFR